MSEKDTSSIDVTNRLFTTEPISNSTNTQQSSHPQPPQRTRILSSDTETDSDSDSDSNSSNSNDEEDFETTGTDEQDNDDDEIGQGVRSFRLPDSIPSLSPITGTASSHRRHRKVSPTTKQNQRGYQTSLKPPKSPSSVTSSSSTSAYSGITIPATGSSYSSDDRTFVTPQQQQQGFLQVKQQPRRIHSTPSLQKKFQSQQYVSSSTSPSDSQSSSSASSHPLTRYHTLQSPKSISQNPWTQSPELSESTEDDSSDNSSRIVTSEEIVPPSVPSYESKEFQPPPNTTTTTTTTPSSSSTNLPSSRKCTALSRFSRSTTGEPDLFNNGLFGAICGISSIAYNISKDVLSYWSRKLYQSVLHRKDSHTYHRLMQQAATTYEQWSDASRKLDELEGKDKWKRDPLSPHYDYELIQDRLHQLRKAREKGDLSTMIFLLRTSISRNLGDTGKTELYTHCHIGTKKLIEDYIEEVVRQLNILCDASETADFTAKMKYEFFMNTQRSFGRTALLLSGGGTFGLTHIGLVKTLIDARLLPRIISGSSVGSIIAGVICSKTDDEVLKFIEPENLRLDVFERGHESGNIWVKLTRLVRHGVLYDVEVFAEAMRLNIGDLTFQEAFNRTRRVLNITVSSSTVYEMPKLLNYLTAPNVLIWSAVVASCAVPFVYKSSPLMAKDKAGKIVPWNPSGHRWIDGSVENDLPMARISEMFNVNHFIVSQVNPHVVPFLHHGNTAPSRTRRLLSKISWLIQSEFQHWFTQMMELGVTSRLVYKLHSVMIQKYAGDITIIPQMRVSDYTTILSNPTPTFVVDCIVRGEAATWPKISIIQNHCRIEVAIDEILYKLRIRKLGVVGSGSGNLGNSNTAVPKTAPLGVLKQVGGSEQKRQSIGSGNGNGKPKVSFEKESAEYDTSEESEQGMVSSSSTSRILNRGNSSGGSSGSKKNGRKSGSPTSNLKTASLISSLNDLR